MAQKSHGMHHGTRHKHQADSDHSLNVNDFMKVFEEGENVRISLNPSVQEGRIHSRFHGRKAKIIGERGSAYRVRLKDGEKQKDFFLKPVHLEEVEN